jgi:phosphopantothenoylcysteine decarboxylase/phosphopantothenate--cysteine ligase
MLSAIEQHFAGASVAIFAAAVADYRHADPVASKIKRSGEQGITLQLIPNPDILATMARKKGDRLIVGFAAETDRVAENARKKLK